jgi:hypothetical protein
VGRVAIARSERAPALQLGADTVGDNPEIEVVGTELYLGAPDVVDGAGYTLRIARVSSTGFWGDWRYDSGIGSVVDSATGQLLANPAGFFCAMRRP